MNTVNMNQPQGHNILFRSLIWKSPQGPSKSLSLLISDVLCRQGGNLWYFMHSQFRWSSSLLSLSVALKWQHHYCLVEHSGDMALRSPLPDEIEAIRKDQGSGGHDCTPFLSLWVSAFMCDGFPLCIHMLWCEKCRAHNRKSKKNITQCCVWLTSD